jgi:hypothetical protein
MTTAVYYAPRSQTFWSIAAPHLAKDQRYQIQGIFLPDRKLSVPVLIVGDPQFMAGVPEDLRTREGAKQILITAYDSSDFGRVFAGLKDGELRTDTRVCTVVAQVSPMFTVRSKTAGTSQNFRGLRYAHWNTRFERHMGFLFHTLKMVVGVEKTLPQIGDDPNRPKRLVGQARFADKTNENWNAAFKEIPNYDHSVIAVFDPDGTDFGEGSDVVTAATDKLNALAAEHPHFTWTTLDKLPSLDILGCPES